MIILYFFLAFTATVVGSVAGIGGGVIIKPVLDLLGFDNINTVSVLSSATVFSMAVVSVIKQIKSGFRIRGVFIFIVIGAAIGGILGKQLFSYAVKDVASEPLKAVQAIILIILLVVALFRAKLPDLEIENPMLSALIGLFLGSVAAFLGIGGGPINVVVICMFLAIDIKEAAVVSILIILFSQGAKLCAIQATTGFGIYSDLHKLVYMIPGGLAGGFTGSIFNRRLSGKSIGLIYNMIVIIIIIINVYNALTVFIL